MARLISKALPYSRGRAAERLDALLSSRLTRVLVASSNGATVLAQRPRSCRAGNACRKPGTVPANVGGFNHPFFPATGFDLADYFDTSPETTTKPAKPTPKPFPRPGKPGTAELPAPQGGCMCAHLRSSGWGKTLPQRNREPSRQLGGWGRALTDELQQVLVATSR